MTNLPLELADWVYEVRSPRKEGDFEEVGSSIGNCIPSTFEAYCKIFHPFEITPDEPETLAPLPERPPSIDLSISEAGFSGALIEYFDERQKEYNSKHWDFISWRTLANKYGLVYHNQMNARSFGRKFERIGFPKNLRFPEEGYLRREIFIQLLDMLKMQDAAGEVCIYQMVPHTIWKDDKALDLVKCSYKEVLEYFISDFKGYLYAADKSWLVFTDTDLSFTLIGGSRKLMEAILESDLEALPCKASTRIDAYSDKVNEKNISPKARPPMKEIRWWKKWINW